MGKQIEYSNGELTIVWQPELCRHAGICVKTLPNVYHPKERPWIKMENATTEELIAQIKKCPSGALSYNLKKLKNLREPCLKDAPGDSFVFIRSHR